MLSKQLNKILHSNNIIKVCVFDPAPMEDMSLTRKQNIILEFIELYRSYPQLWDIDSPLYSNRNSKRVAYDVLVEKYKEVEADASRDTVVKKLNSLRTNYRKELTKVRNSKRSGAGTEEIYQPSLWYYEALSFLADHETPRAGRSTLKTNCSVIEEGYKKGSEDESFEMNITASSTKKTAKKRKSADMGTDDMIAVALHHLSKDDDEFTAVGRGYSEKLKKLTRIQRIYAENLIGQVFMEAELENLTRTSKLVISPNTATSSHSSFTTSESSSSNYNEPLLEFLKDL